MNTAHGICNLKYSLHKEIPINFHNYGSNYDYHFTIKELVETKSYRLQFIDSSWFIASSLSNLVDNTAEGIHKIRSKINTTAYGAIKSTKEFWWKIKEEICQYI